MELIGKNQRPPSHLKIYLFFVCSNFLSMGWHYQTTSRAHSRYLKIKMSLESFTQTTTFSIFVNAFLWWKIPFILTFKLKLRKRAKNLHVRTYVLGMYSNFVIFCNINLVCFIKNSKHFYTLRPFLILLPLETFTISWLLDAYTMHDHLVNHFGFHDFHKLVWTHNTSVAYENHSFCDYTLEKNQKAAMWQDLVMYVNRLMSPPRLW